MKHTFEVLKENYITGGTCSFAKLFQLESDTPIAARDVILNGCLHESFGINFCLIPVFFTTLSKYFLYKEECSFSVF